MAEKFEIGESTAKIMKFKESRKIIELTPPHVPKGETQTGDFCSGCEFYDDVSGWGIGPWSKDTGSKGGNPLFQEKKSIYKKKRNTDERDFHQLV